VSVKQMGMVWELDLPPNHKIVLLAYADHADDDGGSVFPSLGRIAHKTGYSKDQVRRISRELADAGLMEKVQDATPRRGAEYELHLERGSKLLPLKKRGVANDPSPVGAPVPPEPSVEPPEYSSKEANASLSGGGQKQAAPSKPVSYKQYGIRRLMELVNEAKERGEKPAPPDEPYKRRHGDIYEAHMKDGYEAEQLEPALRYLVEVACGKGPGWLQAKKRWVPLVDAIAYAECGYEGSVFSQKHAEPINPNSDAAIAARDKPRKAWWYASAFECSEDGAQRLIDQGLGHSAIMEALERGAA
jgi:DNA-binding MarR family transcriptional regulator